MLTKTKIAVFVSGGGTNLQALIDAQRIGKIKSGEIVLVLEGATEEETAESYTFEQAVALAMELAEKGLRATEAAKQAAAMTGYKKNEIYKELTV